MTEEQLNKMRRFAAAEGVEIDCIDVQILLDEISRLRDLCVDVVSALELHIDQAHTQRYRERIYAG
jgi:hypothetical protein